MAVSVAAIALFVSCGDGLSGTSGKMKHGYSPPHEAGIRDITVVASGLFPPYYFKDEKGAMAGVTAEIVQATLDRAGIKVTISLCPVKRALLTAENQKNVLIFAIARTAEREKHFKWIAPVTPPVRSGLFRLTRRSDIVLKTPDDAKKYRTGVVRGNDLHILFLSRGFRDDFSLEPVVYNEQNIRKLFAGRIDLCAGKELPFYAEIRQLGFDRSMVTEACMLKECVAWMAFSMSTPDDVVERIRDAYRQISDDGTVSRIYGLHNAIGE